MKHAISLGLALALLLTGCKAPAPEPSGPPEAAESLSPVYADWSRLTPYETPERAEVYPRRDGPHDTLLPAPDYGPLVPFPGAVTTTVWYAGEWVTSYLYGLMTLEGEAVADPVYSSVTLLTRWNGGDTPDPLPAMVLTRYTGESDPETGEAVFRSALAARDGSWVTEEVYTFDPDLQYGGMGVEPGQFFALRDENVLVLLDPETGAECFAAPLPGALSRDSRYDALWSAQAGDGRVTVSYYDAFAGQTYRPLCWTLDGQAVPLPEDVTQVGRFSQGLAPAQSGGQWGYLDTSGAWAIPPQYSYARPFENGSALVRGGGFSLISPAGEALVGPVAADTCFQRGGCWYFLGYSGDPGLVLDENLQAVASPLLYQTEYFLLDGGWIILRKDGVQSLVRGAEQWPLPAGWENSRLICAREDQIFLTGPEEWAAWTPQTGALAVFPGALESVDRDPVTGADCCRVSLPDGSWRLTAPDGAVLFDGLPEDAVPSLLGGLCQLSRGDSTTILSPNGTVLLRRYWDDGMD